MLGPGMEERPPGKGIGFNSGPGPLLIPAFPSSFGDLLPRPPPRNCPLPQVLLGTLPPISQFREARG